tara:strand:+ start:371 stop:592 length:222 start_codon:yes stop_codon:yes gene_type:complete
MLTVKEGFSGFHEVNFLVRCINRTSDAIKSLKNGLFDAMDKIKMKGAEESCEHHYQCSSKCTCEKKKCKCIPT